MINMIVWKKKYYKIWSVWFKIIKILMDCEIDACAENIIDEKVILNLYNI